MSRTQPPKATSLVQQDIERWFCDHHGFERWTVLYQTSKLAETSVGLFSCLIPLDYCKESLNHPGWDFSIGDGSPGFSQEWRGDDTVTTYHRLSGDGGSEPLVIVRYFPHGRPSYLEISQELGLLFDLYEDRQTGVFYEMQDDGSEQEVIRVNSDRVEIRTALIRRYLAARQMALLLQVDSDVWFRLADGEIPPGLPDERQSTTDNLCFHFYAKLVSADRPFSRFLGTKIIPPPDRTECGI